MKKYIHDYLLYLFVTSIIIYFFVKKLTIVNIPRMNYLGEVSKNYIVTYPFIALITLYFSLDRYYRSVFVMTRIGPREEVQAVYHRAIKKDTLIIASSVIGAILLFEWLPYSIHSLYARVISLGSVLSLFLLFEEMHIFIIDHYRYQVALLLESVYIVFMMSVLLKMFAVPQLYYYFYARNYPLLIANTGMIIALHIANKEGHELSKRMIRCIVIMASELLSSILMENYAPQDFSLYEVFLPTSVDRFLYLLMWLFPKIILVLICVQETEEMYGHHLLFYIVRIKNRTRWVFKLESRMLLYILIATVAKCIIHFKDYSFKVLFSTSISYICMMLMIITFFILLTCVAKDRGVINGALVGYILLSYGAVLFPKSILRIFGNINQVSAGIIAMIFSFVFFILELLCINKMEYYGGTT